MEDRKPPTNTLWIHLGIVRTGSSTMRNLLRRHADSSNEKTMELKHPGDVVPEDVDYLLLETPYPYHLHTTRPCRYITTLRGPEETVLSEYRFLTNLGQLQDVSYGEYVSSLPNDYNKQARWLAALLETDPDRQSLSQPFFPHAQPDFFTTENDDSLFQKARMAIDTLFDVAYPLDRLEEGLFRLALLAGWRQIPVWRRANPSFHGGSPASEDLGRKEQEKLRNCMKVDTALYRYAAAKAKNAKAELDRVFGDQIERYTQQALDSDSVLLDLFVRLGDDIKT